MVEVILQPHRLLERAAQPALNQRNTSPRGLRFILRQTKGRTMRQTIATFHALISERQQMADLQISSLPFNQSRISQEPSLAIGLQRLFRAP
jgi:hypothetical protein